MLKIKEYLVGRKFYDYKKYKPFLKNYLTEKLGIDVSKPFQCLNTEHEDKTPSMSYWADGDCRARCFSCGARYDIYDSCRFVKKMSMMSREHTQ